MSTDLITNGAGQVVATLRNAHPNDELRAPFQPHEIGKLPRYTGGKNTPKDERDRHTCDECGKYHDFPSIHLDYVGHAAVTDRLLNVDPEWSWEPFAVDQDGLPLISQRGDNAELWIRLTVNGVTRPGVGTAASDKADVSKELISDALRNAGMRFGIALDLWRKGDQDDAAPNGLVARAELNRPCPACGKQVHDNRAAHTNDTKKPAWRCSNRACTGGSNNRSWASWDPEQILPDWPEAVVPIREINAMKTELKERLDGNVSLATQGWVETLELYSLKLTDPIPMALRDSFYDDLRSWHPSPDGPTPEDVDQPESVRAELPVDSEGNVIYPPGEEPFV